jgi:hypothetical protein
MSKMRSRYTAFVLLALTVAVTASLADHVFSKANSARAADVNGARIVPLSSAAIPTEGRTALENFAARSGISAANLLEVGRSPAKEPYRSTVIGVDAAGNVSAAIASREIVTNFARASELFKTSPLVAVTSTLGTTTDLKEVGLTVIANSRIARVAVDDADGSTHDMTLIPWPAGSYSSASTVSSEQSHFPVSVRGYDETGQLLIKKDVVANPLCPPSSPNCID